MHFLHSISRSQKLISKFSQAFSFYAKVDLSAQSSFKAKDLQVIKRKDKSKIPPWDPELLKFGQYNTDHMLTIDWNEKSNWKKPVIQPFKEFSIHPFNSTLHYAIECFEGMKAFRDARGQIRLFRPECNMYRMKISCSKVALPDFDGAEFLKCIQQHILLEKDYVSPKRGFSLYIRPTAISMENKLGVTKPKNTLLFNVLSPVGPYYASGFKPVKLYCDPNRFRAAPGGTGNFKLGGNYAPTLSVAADAEKKGYQQVLWLYHDQVTEVGASNIFFFWKNEQGEDELVTPSLDDGSILPGVVRDSILRLTREWKRFKVTERKLMMSEVAKAIDENRLYEVFGAGTAVVVSSVNGIYYNGKEYNVPINPKYNAGNLTYELLNFIQDIQYGVKEYKNWAPVIGE